MTRVEFITYVMPSPFLGTDFLKIDTFEVTDSLGSKLSFSITLNE